MNNRKRRRQYNSKNTEVEKKNSYPFIKGKQSNRNGRNNPEWYKRFPILAKMASLINFLYPIGLKFTLAANGVLEKFSSWVSPIIPHSIPGIMAITWMPTPGISTTPMSAINVSGDRRFTKMREKNFNTNVYDIADLSFHFLAADSIYTAYGFLCLIYSHLQNYSVVNRYKPRAIIEAMGVDFNDIRNNAAQFAWYINNLKHRIEVLKIPHSMTYTKRHLHMVGYVYKDNDTDKCQEYVLTPKYLLKYDATVPKLEYIDFHPNTKMTFQVLKDKIDSMVEAIIPDEDMNIINADILKFITEDVFTVNDIDWGHQEDPVYDKEMLWQIHNADFLSFDSAENLDITQTITANLDTIIQWDPTFTGKDFGVVNHRIIDSDVNDPSQDEIIESTRLKFIAKPEGSLPTTINGNFNFKILSCGSELVLNAVVYTSDPEQDLAVISSPITTFPRAVIGTLQSGLPTMAFPIKPDWATAKGILLQPDGYSVMSLGCFNYHPMLYLNAQTQISDNVVENMEITTIGDYSNVAVIDDNQLIALNESCILSEFEAF